MAKDGATSSQQFPAAFAAPSISLPKGGGAIRGIGEKFAANPVTGTASMSVPIATSAGRSGFGPQLALSYDSGAGNGPFGFGWSLAIPSITRKTDKGLPQYRDDEESDTFLLSGAEDLVPTLTEDATGWRREIRGRTLEGAEYQIQRYRPRIEGLFARIERWTRRSDGDVHWRSVTRDNVTTVYGKNENSRIFNPAGVSPDETIRIFSWLISESYDDKGNAIVYEYKRENSERIDLTQVHEANRGIEGRAANRYLKRILYGNRESRLIQPDLTQTRWMFEMVFDYGEHDRSVPTPSDRGQWLCRHDPFSTYRPGFEVRTYRLCQRVLMFHHFPEEDGVGADCLVRSTDFIYREYRDVPDNPDDVRRRYPVASFIASVEQCGYRRRDTTYLRRTLPPLEFTYSEPTIDETIRDVEKGSLDNLPVGLDGSTYRWVDLDGEGISGILTEQGGAWFYKRNLSPIAVANEDGPRRPTVRFAPAAPVQSQPSLAALGHGQQQLLDLSGDGQLDLVDFGRPSSGFYERTHNESWEAFRTFAQLPGISWDDPNLRFVDLNGDGHADVLLTEHDVFTWYPSLTEAGFGPARRVCKALDEEKGPRLVFGDGTESVYLADMCGDGLSAVVRIRNGEICYWPNLGYGHFGARITMDNAPWFEAQELFDHRRVRLADIDGTGTNDLIYLGGDGARIYFNQSGNGWSDPHPLSGFPHIDDLASVTTVDLLGNGTACLVWSSPLPGDSRRPMRYIDLMGGQKPHLLLAVKNNLGAETHVHYAPSTRFYLTDKTAGTPWITRLPFPVHVVERVEVYDRISRSRFVTRYAYHHGYFDGVEREFRGFGMIEQWDTEEFAALSATNELPAGDNIDAASHVPPVLTRTWFHTGAYIGHDRVSQFFAGLRDRGDRGEYYREPAWLKDDEEAEKRLLPDTVLPDGLTAEEEREAARALKGMMLRQEVYALDGVGRSADYPLGHPYTVAEQNFTIRLLQPRVDNRLAVFFTHPREALTYHYEREPADPRVQHALTLEVDAYGNVLKSVSIGYGRRVSILEQKRDQDKQTQALVTYTENAFTNAVDEPDAYRTPLACETRTYELTGYTRTATATWFLDSDFVRPAAGGAAHVSDSELKYRGGPDHRPAAPSDRAHSHLLPARRSGRGQ